jgi:hypothetical protein
MRTIGLLFSAALASTACGSARNDANPSPGGDDANDWVDCKDDPSDPDCVEVECDDRDPDCPGYRDPDDRPPGEAEPPTCDVEFPKLEPLWLVEEPSPVADGLPRVEDMLATDDALYLANRHNGNEPARPLGSLERRTLEGELVWAVELEPAPTSLAWDGQHLYAAVGEELRRWSPEGVEGDWRYNARGEISDIAVDDATVALTGYYWVGGVHDSHMDAFYGQVTKTMPLDYLGYAEPTEWEHDVGEAVGNSPWGGWIAGGSLRYSHDYHVWLRGYGGHRLSTSMRTYDHAHVEAIIPGDDVVYVVGWSNSAPSGRWVSVFDSEGTELWSRDLWICPGAAGSFKSLTLVDSELVGVATSRNNADQYPPLIAKVGLDGAPHGVWEVSTNAERLTIGSMTTVGGRIFVGGRHFNGTQTTRIIMEVQP